MSVGHKELQIRQEAVGNSKADCKTAGPFYLQTLSPSDPQTFRPSDPQTLRLSDFQTYFLLNRSISVCDMAVTPVVYAGAKSGAKLLL